MKRLIPLCLAAIVAPAMASAQVIVDDSWADGDRANTGPLQADWWSSSSTSANSIEVVTGAMGLISGTSGRGLHGTFAPQTLGIGDTLTATYTFTTPATVGAAASSLKVAMMDFNNPGLAADLSSSSSSVNPLYVGLPGYMSDFDVNSGASADVSIRKHDVTSGLGRFLGTTSEWIDQSTSADNGYTFAADTEYVGVFSVTRTGADSVDIFSSISQGATLMDSHTKSDSSAIANNFGMFGIWVNSNTFGSNTTAGDPDNGITFSNIKIELFAVPEPSTFALAMGGLLSLGVWRRKLGRTSA